MKNLISIGFAVGAALAGCASTGGAENEPTTIAVAGAHQHGQAKRGVAGGKAAMCPMRVPGTTVAAADVAGGIGLSFTTTTTTNVADLQRRVRRMAERHNQHGGRMMPAATASVDDLEGGARLVLLPSDTAQLGALRDHVRIKAERMTAGECPMMSLGNSDTPAPVAPVSVDPHAHRAEN